MSTSSIWTQRIGGEPFTAEERRQAAVIASGVWRGLAKWSLLVGAVWLFVLLAACSGGATGPQGLDPRVQLSNAAGPDTLHMTWFDQSGQVQAAVLLPGQSVCLAFISTRVADSVRFVVWMGDTTGTPGAVYAKQQSPWFNPATGVGPDPTQYPFGAEFWTVAVPSAYSISMQAVQTSPC